MTLAELMLEVRNILRDPTIESSIPTWINQASLELASQYEIPLLRLREPATLATTATDWLYDLSEATHTRGYEYHKKVWRVASSSQTNGYPIELSIDAFHDADSTGYSATHTDTGTEVQRVAVEGDQLAIYPMAAQDLSLWYYRKPFEVEDDDDIPEVPDSGHHYTLLVPLVVLKAFRVYPDLALDTAGDNTRALQRWDGLRKAGLFGDGFSIGYVSSLQKQRGVHTRGPRPGSQLSGGSGRRLW